MLHNAGWQLHFTDHDLRQIDAEYLERLDVEQLNRAAVNLLNDLKTARERLNQNSSNSSRPPGSHPSWENSTSDEPEKNEPKDEFEETPIQDDDEELVIASSDGDSSSDDVEQVSTGHDPKSGDSSGKKAKPGKQKGAKGYGRTQKLPVDEIIMHRIDVCKGCGTRLEDSPPFTATMGYYVVDITRPNEEQLGMILTCTKHIYGETICTCGHKTASYPNTSESDSNWNVKLSEWRLVGPHLASLICCLVMRMRLSRARIKEFLWDWLGLSLSTGTINQCIHEFGRAVEPLEEELLNEIRNSNLLHADETSWKEHSKNCWLWVFLSSVTVFYTIGSRCADVVKSVLGETLAGWLMSDGYSVYRQYPNRLRCWAHLIRKARGLSESLDAGVCNYGKNTLEIFKQLTEAIYRAREGPEKGGLFIENGPLLTDLFNQCQEFRDSPHDKARALAVEILNDWEAIFRVVDHPNLPLTNNEAERSLRHWVIARRISHGTRNRQGSRAFALLASVIDTCRRRNISTWSYMADVLALRRQGQPVPPIPQAQTP